jgi:cbb3-type cytochrome oxidase subunit 3
MHELPMLALLKEGVLITFFLIFSGLIWWLYLRPGNRSLEEHRFDVLKEDS